MSHVQVHNVTYLEHAISDDKKPLTHDPKDKLLLSAQLDHHDNHHQLHLKKPSSTKDFFFV